MFGTRKYECRVCLEISANKGQETCNKCVKMIARNLVNIIDNQPLEGTIRQQKAAESWYDTHPDEVREFV